VSVIMAVLQSLTYNVDIAIIWNHTPFSVLFLRSCDSGILCYLLYDCDQ